jgi:hypothetical protein
MFKSIDTILDLTKAGFKGVELAGKPRHFAAIGKFMVTVGTEIDARLKAGLLQQIMSDEDTLARAILGDTRIGDVMSALRRIVESRSPDPAFLDELTKLFTEVSNLRRERNIVAHQTCMVSGNKIAFHNAAVARTDATIEVHIYTLSELAKLTEYSRRLGFRIVKMLRGIPRPKIVSEPTRAALALVTGTMLTKIASELIKTKSLKREHVEKLKNASSEQHNAISAYTEVARHIDSNLASLQQEASAKMHDFMAALVLVTAPDDATLLEIPARLQTKRRTPQVGKTPPPARRRKASRK